MKRKGVPLSIKHQVWDKYIGSNVAKAPCFCGNIIESRDHECGHVLSVSKGGTNEIENLRPICKKCNRTMGTENMRDFYLRWFNKDIEKVVMNKNTEESDVRIQLKKHRKNELKAICNQNNIKYSANLTKEKIIDLIIESEKKSNNELIKNLSSYGKEHLKCICRYNNLDNSGLSSEIIDRLAQYVNLKIPSNAEIDNMIEIEKKINFDDELIKASGPILRGQNYGKIYIPEEWKQYINKK